MSCIATGSCSRPSGRPKATGSRSAAKNAGAVQGRHCRRGRCTPRRASRGPCCSRSTDSWRRSSRAKSCACRFVPFRCRSAYQENPYRRLRVGRHRTPCRPCIRGRLSRRRYTWRRKAPRIPLPNRTARYCGRPSPGPTSANPDAPPSSRGPACPDRP